MIGVKVRWYLIVMIKEYRTKVSQLENDKGEAPLFPGSPSADSNQRSDG